MLHACNGGVYCRDRSKLKQYLLSAGKIVPNSGLKLTQHFAHFFQRFHMRFIYWVKCDYVNCTVMIRSDLKRQKAQHEACLHVSWLVLCSLTTNPFCNNKIYDVIWQTCASIEFSCSILTEISIWWRDMTYKTTKIVANYAVKLYTVILSNRSFVWDKETHKCRHFVVSVEFFQT